MSEAKTPQPGEYWVSDDGSIIRIVGTKLNGSVIYENQAGLSFQFNSMIQWRHEPRCTGFDWVEPAAIDPGEGWELLPVGTVLQDGDEVLLEDGSWDATDYVGCKVGDIPSTACAYRRKIKPVESPNDWVEITDRDHKLRAGIDQFNTSIWWGEWSYVYDSCGKTVTQAGFKSARCRRRDLPVPMQSVAEVCDPATKALHDLAIHAGFDPLGLDPCDIAEKLIAEHQAPPQRVPVRLWRDKESGQIVATMPEDVYCVGDFAVEVFFDADGFYVDGAE